MFELDEDDATMYLGHEGWKYLFDKKVNPIITHVENLLKTPELKDCKTMLCIGGLSKSEYVMERLRLKFKEPKRITILVRPERPILAVVEGAVRFGLSPSIIIEYVMNYTYGVMCSRPWMESDGIENQLWDDADKIFVFENGFEKFAEKGEKMKAKAPPKVKWFQPLKKGDKQILIQIHRTLATNPKTATEDSVCGEGAFDLPSDWWTNGDADEKEIPVAFFFNSTEIKVKVELPNYEEKKRFIRIKWREGV